MTVETPLSGRVITTVVVNLRQGAPNTAAAVLRKLGPGTWLGVTALAIGQSVQGNARWYRTDDGAYVWSGGCGPLQDVAAAGSPPAAPLSPLVAQLDQTPLVVDLSHGDGVASFRDAKAAGVVGVIHKATTGASGRDDAYRGRRIAAAEAGLLWGAYHWGTAAPVEDQVANFLEWAQPDANTLVALDFEETIGNQMTLEGVRQFSELISAKLQRRPVIYGGHLLKSALGVTVDPFFSQHRLWLAQYGPTPTPPHAWPAYWLWQYTDGEYGPGCKSVPGLPGDAKRRLDCNHFGGTAAELAAQWAS